TVMSGTPTLITAQESLKASNITKIEGILNGTTNYILTRMEEGLAYEKALEEAQELGYAEADPTGDIEGVDPAGKVVILANLLMGQKFKMKDVFTKGITDVTQEDMKEANKKQKMLLCIKLKNSNGGKTKMSNINDVNVENLKDYMGVITNDKEKAMIDYNVNLEWQGGTKSKVTTNDIQLGDETLKRDFSFYID